MFIDLTASEQNINDLEEQIHVIEGIKEVRYISKQQAAERFKQEFGEDIKEVLDYNPFPASFVITLQENFRNLNGVNTVKSKLEDLNYVDEIVYQKTLLETIDRYINFIFLGILLKRNLNELHFLD